MTEVKHPTRSTLLPSGIVYHPEGYKGDFVRQITLFRATKQHNDIVKYCILPETANRLKQEGYTLTSKIVFVRI
jgi:hypothetical protein